MKIQNKNYLTIKISDCGQHVNIIDQTLLPHSFEIKAIHSLNQMIEAIKTMQVRGAPLIGASAAYGMMLAMQEDASDAALDVAAKTLIASRPTAVNLRWAVERVYEKLQAVKITQRFELAKQEAQKICDEDVQMNYAIGQHGFQSLHQLYTQLNRPLNILTHCNAGWLATVDWGTALAPIYVAHNAGLPVHVWVDETRPRNQGASLTAWELGQHGVPHTVISDNAGGHLMQHGQVDMVIVGADRVTRTGDICNKIGTYLKALAAFDNHIPFYAAVPSPTIDWAILDGLKEIEIEERSADELAYISGLTKDGSLQTVRVIPPTSKAANPAFDVTPARLVAGIITERGIFTPQQLATAFTEV